MSHVSRLSPALATALLGTTAAIRLPDLTGPSNPTTAQAQAPLHRFTADADALAETLSRGLAAARALIADPRPYRINTDTLQGMVDALTVIAEADAVDPSHVVMPADAFDMLHECIRAERARCAKRGEAWAVAETVAAKAAQVMFAFSEARRRLASGQTVNVGGYIVTAEA